MARDFVLSIDAGFTSHSKTQRFCRLMADPLAFGYLIQLWTWAVEAAPMGDLAGHEPDDIEWATGYRGGDGRCFAALVKAGFVDADQSGAPIALHNWMKPGHTGFAIKQMEADRRRWRRAKGLPDDSARNPGGDSKEVTVASPGTPAPSRFTVHGSHEEAPPAPAIPGGTWSAWEWFSKFGRQWSDKYQRLTYGQGEGDSKAIGALVDILEALPFDERAAAQLLAPEMIAEYLADESPGRVKARHPWKWFVEGFNGFRAPKVRVVANSATGPPRGPPAHQYKTLTPRKLGPNP